MKVLLKKYRTPFICVFKKAYSINLLRLMNARGNALLLEEKERKFVNKQLPKVEEELHLLIRGRSPNWFWSLSIPHKPLKPNNNQF